jgi:hypothetical protein
MHPRFFMATVLAGNNYKKITRSCLPWSAPIARNELMRVCAFGFSGDPIHLRGSRRANGVRQNLVTDRAHASQPSVPPLVGARPQNLTRQNEPAEALPIDHASNDPRTLDLKGIDMGSSLLLQINKRQEAEMIVLAHQPPAALER